MWDLRGRHGWRREGQEGGCHSNAGKRLGESKLLGIEKRGGVQRVLGVITEYGISAEREKGRHKDGL